MQALDQFEIPFKVRFGTIQQINVTIPGGATRLMGAAFSGEYRDSIRVQIDGVYVLVDKQVQSPEELCRRVASNKLSALVWDATTYRQTILERIQSELAGLGNRKMKSSLLDAILRNLVVSVTNVHVRYEDVTSQSGHPFAVGVTLASAVTDDGSSSPAFAGSAATVGSQTRRLRVSYLALYLDHIPRTELFGNDLTNVSALLSRFEAGIATRHNRPLHAYILLPEETVQAPATVLDFTTNALPPSGAAAGGSTSSSARAKIHVKLHTSSLHMCATQAQFHSLVFLSAWVQDARQLELVREVRRKYFAPLPALPPSVGGARASRPSVHAPVERMRTSRGIALVRRFQAAAQCVMEMRSRQKEAILVPRWDFSRTHGWAARRQAYITAYTRLLVSEYNLMEKSVRKGSTLAEDDLRAAGGSALHVELGRLEDVLLYEQVLDFRAEARVAFERSLDGRAGQVADALAASAAVGSAAPHKPSLWGSFVSAFSSAKSSAMDADSVLASASSPVRVDAGAHQRAVAEQYEKSLASGRAAASTLFEVSIRALSFTLARSSPADAIVTLKSRLHASIQMTGPAVQIDARVEALSVFDNVSTTSAFRQILAFDRAARSSPRASAGFKILAAS
ncbi:MAG: hypothetical protein EOO65_03490, partial [Methanosarcinales archaeon]